jgi:LysM repeat protein
MSNKIRLVRLAAVLILVSVFLVACERPFQNRGDTAPGEVPTVAVPETIGGTTEPVAAATPEPTATEAGTQGQSPRVEATATPVAVTPEPTSVPETPAEEATEEVAEEAAAESETTGEAAAQVTPEATPEPSGVAAVTPTPPPAPRAATTHVVAPGENLYRIALRYGLPWVALAQHNNIANANSIRVGQVLQIPATDVTPISTPALETTYVVQRGDNLYRISLMFNVSWTQIAEANGIVNPNQVYVGQVLKIPVSAPGPGRQFAHVVQRGETLFQIAVRYGVPWQRVAQANNLTAPYVIYVGQSLVIPGN